MSLDHDPIFDALANLRPVEPDTEREVRVQNRCRSAITKRVARRGRGKRYREGLAYLSAAAVLCIYMAAMFAQALRLAHF